MRNIVSRPYGNYPFPTVDERSRHVKNKIENIKYMTRCPVNGKQTHSY